jgi:hypothetical protein
MNNRSTNTSNASHRDKRGRNHLWLSALLLLLLAIGIFFVQSSATFAQQEGVWSGIVTDEGGNPLPALVTINGQPVQADGEGNFKVEAPSAERNVINVELLGYAPVSYIQNGSVAIQGLDIQLKTAQRFEIDPNQPIQIEDERGTRISIPEGGLVDAEGKRAEKPLTVYLYTYKLDEEPIPGDMSGTDFDGNLVAMFSHGSFDLTIADEQGNLYNLESGVEAEISVPLFKNAPETPDSAILWHFQKETGLWNAEGIAELIGDRYVGRVKHFSPWNVDVWLPQPSCVKVTIDPVYLAANSGVTVRVEAGSPTFQVGYWWITQSINIVPNLPANTVVRFYIPDTASTPITTVNSGAAWGGATNPPYPYNQCRSSVYITPPTPTPTPTPTPVIPTSDTGDAPSSMNALGMGMSTYGGTTIANFPTTFGSGTPPGTFGSGPGPIHWNPSLDSWLGAGVSLEQDADTPPDADGPTNIDPSLNLADQDRFDDGVLLPLSLPACATTAFPYELTVVGLIQNRFINVWFDFNGDGDWNDTYSCPNGLIVTEWAVQNQVQVLGPGVYTLLTPPFVSDNLSTLTNEMWMRITVSEAPAAIPADGRGPVTGFRFGETEDYYLTLPAPTPTPTPAPPPPPLYCYNWDFFNRTGHTANDFHLTLQGPKEINIFYQPNPFGNPVKQGLTASGLYEIHYEGADVRDGSLIHLGFCSNSPVANLVGSEQLPPYYWTYNGQPLQKQQIPAVGFHWSFNEIGAGVLQPVLGLTNATAQEIRIHRVDWAISESAIPLDDLNWEPLDGILAWQPLDQETSLPPSEGGDHITSLHYEIPVESVGGDSRSIVYRVWAYEPGNPDNLIKGVGQLSMSQ